MLKAGFINFMPFGLKGDEYYDTLKSYAEIGYKGFENATSLLQGDVEANLNRVRSFGMEPIDIGEKIHGFREPAADPKEVVEACHKLGVTRLTSFDNVASMWRFSGKKVVPTYDDVMREIEDLEAKAAFYAKEGIDIMYHNHDAEFMLNFRGTCQYDIITANTEYLKFELDIGWSTYAGVDTVKLIRRLGKRISVLHVKDYLPIERPYGMMGRQMEDVIVPTFTAVGSGKLDLYGCLEAADQAGIEWACVEQDMLNKLDYKQSLTCAFLNMKETGFVE